MSRDDGRIMFKATVLYILGKKLKEKKPDYVYAYDAQEAYQYLQKRHRDEALKRGMYITIVGLRVAL